MALDNYTSNITEKEVEKKRDSEKDLQYKHSTPDIYFKDQRFRLINHFIQSTFNNFFVLLTHRYNLIMHFHFLMHNLAFHKPECEILSCKCNFHAIFLKKNVTGAPIPSVMLKNENKPGLPNLSLHFVH